jgi:DNA-binding transcriptional ArsR family regulator
MEPTTPGPCSSTTLWAGRLPPDAASDRRRSGQASLSLAQLCKYVHIHADLQTDAVDRVDHADDQWVELAVEIFKMLADATRVRIVLALRNGELSVNTLAEEVGKSPAAVSQHRAKLRLARMVTTRHEGTRVFYRLTNEHAQQLVSGRSPRPSTPSRISHATTGTGPERCDRDVPAPTPSTQVCS